jgi:hypothetical protein
MALIDDLDSKVFLRQNSDLSYRLTLHTSEEMSTRHLPATEVGRLIVPRSLVGRENKGVGSVTVARCGNWRESSWVVILRPTATLTAPSYGSEAVVVVIELH